MKFEGTIFEFTERINKEKFTEIKYDYEKDKEWECLKTLKNQRF